MRHGAELELATGATQDFFYPMGSVAASSKEAAALTWAPQPKGPDELRPGVWNGREGSRRARTPGGISSVGTPGGTPEFGGHDLLRELG